MQYGLIGYPLGHSFSPAYFAAKFAREGISAKYGAFPLERIEDLPALIEARQDLRGLNVTTPHKQAVIPYLHALSGDAGVIGAVNCISMRAGRLGGYNTDWTGFRDSLKPLLQAHHTAALVLGNGGASLAVRYALHKMNLPFLVVSRRQGEASLLYSDVTPAILRQHPIIINTTVLGTEGKGCPDLPFEALRADHLLFDLVYNPAVTPFMKEGLKRGATVSNGLDMLERQAEASWEIWQRI